MLSNVILSRLLFFSCLTWCIIFLLISLSLYLDHIIFWSCHKQIWSIVVHIVIILFCNIFFSLSHIIIIHSPKYIPFPSECSCQISLSIPFSLFISHLNSILEFNRKLSHLYHITFFINLSIFWFHYYNLTSN